MVFKPPAVEEVVCFFFIKAQQKKTAFEIATKKYIYIYSIYQDYIRWFKPWPFDPLVGGHQQPFKGSRFYHPKKQGSKFMLISFWVLPDGKKLETHDFFGSMVRHPRPWQNAVPSSTSERKPTTKVVVSHIRTSKNNSWCWKKKVLKYLFEQDQVTIFCSLPHIFYHANNE